MKEIYYIGLDVHKDTVAIAYIKSRDRNPAAPENVCVNTGKRTSKTALHKAHSTYD